MEDGREKKYFSLMKSFQLFFHSIKFSVVNEKIGNGEKIIENERKTCCADTAQLYVYD